MLPLNHPARWRAAGIVLLLAVLAFAMAPEFWPWSGHDDGRRFLSDKWAHGFTFAVLALWYAGQYTRRSYWWLALGLFVFGILIEVCQSMITYRTAEFADLVADTIGIVVGMLIALAGVGGWSLRVETWLQNRFG